MTDTTDQPVASQELQRQVQQGVIERIRVTPQEAKQAVDDLHAVIASVLQPKRDFWQIPGTPKPSLLKPGAERLQTFFGLGQKIVSREHGMIEDDQGKPAFYALTTVAITRHDGSTIAESDGWCDDTEQGRGGRKWKGSRNTILKMSWKRAYVSAVMAATGTSDFFTVDTEDNDVAAPPPAELPAYLRDRPIEGPEANAFLRTYVWATGKNEEQATEWLYANAPTFPGQPPQPSLVWTARQMLRLLALPEEKLAELREQTRAERDAADEAAKHAEKAAERAGGKGMSAGRDDPPEDLQETLGQQEGEPPADGPAEQQEILEGEVQPDPDEDVRNPE